MVIDEAAPAEDSGFGFVFEGFGAKIKIKGEVDKAVSTQIIETTQKQYAAHEGERITKTLIGAVSGVAVAGIAVAGMALWLKAPKATIVPKASFAVCFSPSFLVSETDRILGKDQGSETRDAQVRDATVPCRMEQEIEVLPGLST